MEERTINEYEYDPLFECPTFLRLIVYRLNYINRL